MKSLLLMSLIVFTFVASGMAARDPRPVRGLRRLIVAFVIFVCIYYFYVSRVNTELFVPVPSST